MPLHNLYNRAKKQVADYFAPAPQPRLRDYVRHIPRATGEAIGSVLEHGPAEAYYRSNPAATKNVRLATLARFPEELAKNTLGGTIDLTKTAGKVFGEGLAYAVDPNVRRQVKSGNLDILPTISSTTPTQMMAKGGKAALEMFAPKGLKYAAGAKQPSIIKRAAYGAAPGYAYDVTDRLARGDDPLKLSTYRPGLGTLFGGLLGAGTKPGMKEARGIAADVTSKVPIKKRVEYYVDKQWKTLDDVIKGEQEKAKKFVYGPGEEKRIALEKISKAKSRVFETPDPSQYKSELIRRMGGKGGLSIENTAGKMTDDLPSLSKTEIITPPQKIPRSVEKVKKQIDSIVREEAEMMKQINDEVGGVHLMQVDQPYGSGGIGYRRVSTNDDWYRDFYRSNKRPPNKAEMRSIAEERLRSGVGMFSKQYKDAVRVLEEGYTTDEMNRYLAAVSPQKRTKAQIIRESAPADIRKAPPLDFDSGMALGNLRGLPSGERLMLPSGEFTAKTPVQAKALFRKYGEAPELQTKQRYGRTIYVSPSGVASSTPKKALKSDLVQQLGDDYEDISVINKGWQDVYRNFTKFFGEQADLFKEKYLRPLERGKGMMYRNLEKHASELDEKIVKGMGFGRGSKESAAIQQFGEGLRDRASLVKEFGEAKAEKIIEADKWFRQKYDLILYRVNKARSYVYPNNPEKQIARRQDYYRHFRELQDGFAGLKNIFETPAGIDNKLAGTSNLTKPKSKWASFMQKRLGNKTEYDAVGGYIDYVGAAEYAANVDTNIGRVRLLAESLAEQGNKTGKDYNNMIQFLTRWADDLSGKTNFLDRGVQEATGRKLFKTADWINRRVKANTILGNASSSLAQATALPAGIASTGEKNFIKGAVRLFSDIGKADSPMRQSTFINERYFDAFNKFDTGLFNNTKKFAAWMVTALDELSTKTIWNAHYEKALSIGNKNPIQYANDKTRSIVAGRGIGEVPLLQRSRIVQMVAPFQLEVANQWPLMKELYGEGAGTMAKFLVYSFVVNRVLSKVRGSDVSFDPINAIMEGVKSVEEDDTIGQRTKKIGGRLFGEVLSNVPLGQTAALTYPEYGKKDVLKTGIDLPTREKFFGKGDPTRFGGGMLMTQGLQDPLYRLLPPFGGSQIRKTLQGINTVNQGYGETQSGRVTTPVGRSFRNYLQGGIFGKGAIPEMREYYDQNRRPLGDEQSEKFRLLGGSREYYDKVQAERQAEKEKKNLRSGKKSSKVGDIGGVMMQLSNGSIYVPSLDKTYQSTDVAKLEIAKSDFLKGGKSKMDYEDKIFIRNKDNTISVKDRATYEFGLTEQKLINAKAEKNYDEWNKLAKQQYDRLIARLQDPDIDELEAEKIKGKLRTLLNQASKIQAGEGAFGPSLSQLEEWKDATAKRKVTIMPSRKLPQLGRRISFRPTTRRQQPQIRFRISSSKI